MAVFKSLTFDGINSLNYGIYVTGEAVYNAPERAVEMVTIPGRNGALAIDQGYFDNIEVSYPCGCFAETQADFAEKVSAFRNAIGSRYSYKRLTDEYNADEYRLGLYKSGLEVDAVRYGTAGQFTITFDCKPQRFLLDGDAELSPTDYSDVHTVSGDIVQIDNDGSLGIKSLTASIEPIQSGSGTPSPDNVRPISGRMEVVTQRTGGQLIDTSTNQSGAIDASGNEVANATFNRTDFIPIDKARICVKTTLASGYVIRVHGYSASKAWVQQIKAITTDGTNMLVEEDVPSGIAYARVSYPLVGVDNTELWQADTYTTPLGRTVYGGTLDVVSGVLTVDRAMVDLGTLTWKTYSGKFTSALNPEPLRKVLGEINMLCSIYKTGNYGSSASQGDGTIWLSASTSRNTLYVEDSRYTDATAFKTAMSGAQLVYELATPQTYQLTPQQIELLLGENHLWSDGEITVEYGVHPYYNPTPFASKPLIKVTGTGTLGIGEYILTITGTASQTLYIDCETMEIYTLEGTVPTGASSLVSINKNDFPVLEPGTNYISVGSGITAVTITPRWWRI